MNLLYDNMTTPCCLDGTHIIIEIETYITMPLLNKFKERSHIWSSKMIDCLQTREYRCFRQSLEMVFTNILKKFD